MKLLISFILMVLSVIGLSFYLYSVGFTVSRDIQMLAGAFLSGSALTVFVFSVFGYIKFSGERD